MGLGFLFRDGLGAFAIGPDVGDIVPGIGGCHVRAFVSSMDDIDRSSGGSGGPGVLEGAGERRTLGFVLY